MDIRQWLDNAATSVQLGHKPPQDLPDFPPFLQPATGKCDNFTGGRRPKRRLSSSGTSFLEAADGRAGYRSARHEGHGRKDDDRSDPCHDGDGDARSSAEADEDTCSVDYTRRPRRKTRADRYDPRTDKESGKRKSKKRSAANASREEAEGRKHRLPRGLDQILYPTSANRSRLTVKQC